MNSTLESKTSELLLDIIKKEKMKTITSTIILLTLQLNLYCQIDIKDYLQQNCPDSIPEVFLKGIVSGKHHEHSSPFFESDGKIVTWTTVRNGDEGHVKMKTIYENKSFNTPTLVPSIVDPSLALHFRLNYNGKESKIVFCSRKPLSIVAAKNIPIDSLFIQYFNSELFRELPYPILYDSTRTGYRITSISKNNTLFLDKRKIYYSKLIGGEFQQPKLFCGDINSKEHDWMPFIAPDESYAIFVSDRDGGYGSYDLYITFKNIDKWTEPINMGERVNTGWQERCPGVTPDGKYLFFTRPNPPNKDDVWWISAKIIEDLR